MSMIDGIALLDWLLRYCTDCDRRKGIKNGKYRTLYDIGDAPCRACDRFDVICEIQERIDNDNRERKDS